MTNAASTSKSSQSRPKPKARVKPQALKAPRKTKKLQTKFTVGRVGPEHREHARFKVVPMYSTVTVRRTSSSTTPLEGHLYEISEGGIRFELDGPLALGRRLDLEITLPGCSRAIAVRGKIVRVNDVLDDPGPRRMGLRFESFLNDASRAALRRYLSERWLARAA